MNHLQLAFLIGLFGSFHCLGMCGPLAFAIPGNHENKLQLIIQKFIYQIGRATTYALLGLLIGLLGQRLWIAGLQQKVSVVSGAVILLFVAFRFFPWVRDKTARLQNKAFSPINKLIIKSLKYKSGHYFIGTLNGFLPCGFVYLALATALNSSNAFQSSLFMFFFGLGTLPLMLLASLGTSWISIDLRNKLNNLMPWLMAVLGIWFILRGMNLNIPYLSPVINSEVICQ
jgi:sulfite exporter TauE/SafE